jgi:hypothetical protein
MFNKLYFFLVSFIIFFVLGSNILKAQNKDYYGFRCGISISNQVWKGKETPSFWGDNKVGFVFGLYYAHSFSKLFDLQSEINYLQEGSYIPGLYYIENGIQKKAVSSFDYLSIVELSKFKFKFYNSIPYIYIGPRFDILIHNSTFGFIQPHHINKIDYGFSIGCGIELSIFKKIQTNFEGRYNQGLNKIGSFLTSIDAISVQNHSFEIVICIGLK